MTNLRLSSVARASLLTFAMLVLIVPAARAQTTALFLDSQFGDVIGQGAQHTYSAADAAFSVSRNYRNGVSLSVTGPSYSFWWNLAFAAAGNVPLAAQSYETARSYSLTAPNGLSISSSSGCSELTGRFVVREVTYAANGTVLRFAADFEQHCYDADPGLFGAIRYNSTISDLVPFGGQYPSYEFSVTTPLNGHLAGSGIDCGGGATACLLTFGTATDVTVTATPDSGYILAGWTGECEGSATVAVHVNGPKRCAALFEPTVLSPRTLLVLDSEPGDSVGQGESLAISPAASRWTFSPSPDGNQLRLRVDTLEGYWSFTFVASPGERLAVGSYEARQTAFPTLNGLDVSKDWHTCSSLTGRYDIEELVYAIDGSVQRFAVDFEQHCNNADPGLFGAIRFASTISEIVPFDGEYPLYQLAVTTPTHGRVTGSGIDCGGPGSACLLTLAAPEQANLTATADDGYIFAGWIYDCSGGANSVSIRVNGPKRCSALFEPAVTSSPRTLLILESQAGDAVGQGKSLVYSPANSRWTLSNWEGTNQLYLQVDTISGYWFLRFSAYQGGTLAVGSYAARERAFPPFNGMTITGPGSCSTITGRYAIRELVYAADRSVQRLAIDFEQHCNDAGPALFGVIRYNSTIGDVVPFGGQYPVYQLSVAPPVGGRVSGGGIDCGGAGTACLLTPGSPTTVTLTATPDAGYMFTAWTGDCIGTATTSLNVNGPKACSSLFEAINASPPRTLVAMVSEAGDYIGQGKSYILSPANTIWSISTSSDHSELSLAIQTLGGWWDFEFSASRAAPLVPGTYGTARRYPFTPFNGLDVSGDGRGCNELTGRYVIRELTYTSDGTVERFAADFEQHCEDVDAGLFGAIRYNSTITGMVPFDGQYPSYQLSITPSNNGRVTASGIDCGETGSSCLLTLAAATRVTLTAAPKFGYMFMGWTEDCHGGTTTSVHVNGPKRCAAIFEPSIPSSPRTLLLWNSEPGNYIGQGKSEVYSPANSDWMARSLSGRSGIAIDIFSVDDRSDSYWTFVFRAPTGELLQAGRRYDSAKEYPEPGAAGLAVFGNGRYCGGGEFTVRELEFGANDAVVRTAIDFVLDCGQPTGPKLTVSLQYNSRVDLPVTTITIDPTSLRFAALHNGVTVTSQPAPQTIRVTLSRQSVGWTATSTQPWVSIAPASGTGSSAVTVGVNVLGGNPGSGSASATLTFTLTDGSGTTKTVPVSVTLLLSGTTAAPFGFADTPLDYTSGVTGAVPFTGWALDDVEVTGVTVCRGIVPDEVAPPDARCGTAQVFVGDAVFVDGARPDVQAAFAAYPRSNVAGWGFMVLTNTLPYQGNGTFVFSIYAHDREGHTVRLGTKTMACDNMHATLPFGTIDTPGQGETVPGGIYANFGWALTQNPKVIPFDGSTIMVYVDGLPVGNASYNHYRSDIATIFPGLANSNGAVGYRMIDTTTLTNGLHTIVWTATDSAGAMSGLGSRYFRVMNGQSVVAAAAAASTDTRRAPTAAEVAAVPLDTSDVIGRRGWDTEGEWRLHSVGRSGRAMIRGEEIDRFELQLGEHEGDSYTGYLRVADKLNPLPIGSRLDAQSGTFTWSPGVGFIGAYDLVFVRWTDARMVARREVRIIVQPKGSGYVGTQIVIDAPRWQQDVPQPFLLGGWAADLDAAVGTGIDTLHVWAYPLSSGRPVFLGTATYGGIRPDVAAVHGDQFRESGFGLTVQGLEPGNYDLAVFAWSNVTGEFAPARVVRVTIR